MSVGVVQLLTASKTKVRLETRLARLSMVQPAEAVLRTAMAARPRIRPRL